MIRTLTASVMVCVVAGCGGPVPDQTLSSHEQAVFSPPGDIEDPLTPIDPELPGGDDPVDPGDEPGDCGDHQCDPNETCQDCPADCGQCPVYPVNNCGDALCNFSDGETCKTCPDDCGNCGGDGLCANGETGCSCPMDCLSPCNANGQFSVTVPDTPKFIPPWTGQGDRDFAGHGPMVWVSARARVAGNEIWADVYMLAVESQGDRTRAEGTTSFKVYSHNKPIKQIVSDTFSRGSYTDGNSSALFWDIHTDDLVPLPPGELVHHFRCTGDTAGVDAGVDTGVIVRFRPITFIEL